MVSRALGNIYAGVTVRLPVKGFLNASISRRGAKRAWIFETDIHLRLLCYLAGTIAERTSVSYCYYYFFQPDLITRRYRFPAFQIFFLRSHRSQDSRYFESCSGKKFKTRLKRGNRGYVNLLQRENWLASVIDSYVLRLRSFEGTGICLTADLFSIHGQFDGAAAAAPAPALFAIRYNVACIWITFHDMSI